MKKTSLLRGCSGRTLFLTLAAMTACSFFPSPGLAQETPVVAAPPAAVETPATPVAAPPAVAETPAVPAVPAVVEPPAPVTAPPAVVEPPAPVVAPPPAVVAPEPPKVIIKKLAGLVFIKNPKEVVASGVPGAGVVIRDIPLLEDDAFKEKMNVYLGKPLTEAGRTKIIEDVVLFFRSEGRSVVDVSTPPQEITSGVLQILVLEGNVGDIRVEGTRWFNPKRLAGQMRIKPGAALDSSEILKELDWINRNPFRQVDLVYAKGSELGKTDLVLRTSELFPLRFYTGYEDSGTEMTDDNRLLAGVNWGNVFGLDGQLNYQYIGSPDFSSFQAHSASFTQPLPWRHILTLFGSYADTRADVPSPFTMGGFSWQAGARYEVPLPIVRGGLRHSLVGGLDFKRSNNNLAFGGIKVFNSAADVAQASLGYNASLTDAWGMSSLRSTIFYSPGGITDKNDKADFTAARAGATARYVYGKIELNRTTGLPWDFMLINLVTVQMSNSNLLAGEQIGFGGYDTIRGYDNRVFNSDHGISVSNELRTPPFSLLGAKRFKDRFQFLAFLDYGVGGNRHRLAGERASTELLGAGPGLRYTINPYLSVRADYGWQLHNVEADRRSASRGHFGVVLSY